MSKRFRTAYVIEKGRLHNKSAIEPYAEEVRYILTGSESNDEIALGLKEHFLAFDATKDVIILAGRVLSSFMFGYFIGFVPAFYVGIYHDKTYSFMKVGLQMFAETPK